MNDVTHLGQVMSNTADLLCGCLAGTPFGEPGFCGVTWSTPVDDLICDNCPGNGALFVWMERMFPFRSFPVPWIQPASNEPLRVAATIAVRLIRPCWPMFQPGPAGGVFPPYAQTETFALNLAIDASTVECCLLTDVMGGDSVITGGPCAGAVSLGMLETDRNRAGCAGFTTRLTVDLQACCVPLNGS